MTECDERILIETEQRSKSNLHRIDAIEQDIKSIKDDQKAVYKIATSVEVIAERMSHIEDKVDETGRKVDAQATAWQEAEQKLTAKIEETEHKPEKQVFTNVNSIKLALITALLTAVTTGALTGILKMFF